MSTSHSLPPKYSNPPQCGFMLETLCHMFALLRREASVKREEDREVSKLYRELRIVSALQWKYAETHTDALDHSG